MSSDKGFKILKSSTLEGSVPIVDGLPMTPLGAASRAPKKGRKKKESVNSIVKFNLVGIYSAFDRKQSIRMNTHSQ